MGQVNISAPLRTWTQTAQYQHAFQNRSGFTASGVETGLNAELATILRIPIVLHTFKFLGGYGVILSKKHFAEGPCFGV